MQIYHNARSVYLSNVYVHLIHHFDLNIWSDHDELACVFVCSCSCGHMCMCVGDLITNIVTDIILDL